MHADDGSEHKLRNTKNSNSALLRKLFNYEARLTPEGEASASACLTYF